MHANRGSKHGRARWTRGAARSCCRIEQRDHSMPEAYAPEIAAWEAFFNGDSLKEQLMSRYMFEHLFLANIYFDELGTDEHFRLVRSTTPPGQPIDIIATRRPNDDPGVARPYYRLQRNSHTVVSKTNMAYALNAKRLQRLKALFLEPDYQVHALPDYQAVGLSCRQGRKSRRHDRRLRPAWRRVMEAVPCGTWRHPLVLPLMRAGVREG